MRWYASATARLLLRHWQALVLLLGVLACANVSLFSNLETFAHPLLVLLAPRHGAAWRCAYLLALLALAALWAGMQRTQIGGGGFMAYAASLPFSMRQRRLVDLAVLVLADSPLLLIVGGALDVAAGYRSPIAHLVLLADVALLALAAQLAMLERRLAGAAGVAIAGLVLAAGFGTRLAPALDVAVGVAAILALGLGPVRARRRVSRMRPRPRTRVHPWPARLLRAASGPHAPALQVALAVLYRERRGEALAKAALAAGLGAAAIALTTLFDDDGRSFPVVLLAQGAIALTASGLFRGLDMAHRASLDFVAALPLPAHWWRRFDLAAVLGFCLPFLAVPALFAWCVGAAPAGRLLGATLSAALLACALRLPQLASERHAVVLSTIVAGCWIGATAAILA